MARGADHAGRVAFIDEHEGVVFFGEVADLVHGSHVAVHREDAVGADDAEALCLGLFETAFEVGHVAVGITVALGFAEAHAVDDGGVVEGVADDGVVGCEERFEDAAVGVEAGGVENGVFGLEEVGDGGFELLVDVLRAADEADGRHAVAAAVHHVLGGLDEARVVGEAEVVVGAEVEHLFASHLDGGLLGPFDEAFAFVKAGCLDVGQLLG